MKAAKPVKPANARSVSELATALRTSVARINRMIRNKQIFANNIGTDTAPFWIVMDEDFEDYRLGQGLFSPGIDSDTRCKAMLRLLQLTSCSADFWTIVNAGWCSCDAVSKSEQSLFLQLLLKVHSDPGNSGFIKYLDEECRNWWIGLRSHLPLRIFRGCALNRIDAMSWTLSRSVAEKFAYGHRNIRPNKPAIAEATVLWKDVFFAINERKEQEVLVDFRSLKIMKIEPYATKSKQSVVAKRKEYNELADELIVNDPLNENE